MANREPHFIIAIVLLLVGCATRQEVTLSPYPLSDERPMRMLFEPDRLHPVSRRLLARDGLMEAWRSEPEAAARALEDGGASEADWERRLAFAEICFDAAERSKGEGGDRAVGFYLAAAEATFPEALDSEDESGPGVMAQLYDASVASLTLHLWRGRVGFDRPYTAAGPTKRYRVVPAVRHRGGVDPRVFSNLFPDTHIRSTGAGRKREGTTSPDGFGVPLAGFLSPTPQRLKEIPNFPLAGRATPLNASLTFTGEGESVRHAVFDVLERDAVEIGGRERKLAMDFRSALGILKGSVPVAQIGRRAMLRPGGYAEYKGLFALEPYRSEKIPVVFVHGLMSQPDTWQEAVTALYEDPVLRRLYQPLVFLYPTGLPIPVNAAELRGKLIEYQRDHDPDGTSAAMRKMVLVGHSMGGVLSSAMIRTSGDRFEKLIFEDPVDGIADLTEEEKRNLNEILNFEPVPHVSRVLFICVPHRGSEWANRWVGRLGSGLIKYPFQLITSSITGEPEKINRHTTELGRSVFNKPPDSVDNLKVGNPFLDTLVELPLNPSVTYHTIVGNRGKQVPLEDSSDGVVPYWSAHVDGAASEVVVPSGHSATGHPRTIEEIRRILYLHLGKRPGTR